MRPFLPFLAALAVFTAACAGQSTGTSGLSARAVGTAPFNTAAQPPDDCWAKLYEHENFRGRVLTVVGPGAIARLTPFLGFPWDPRYESLVVGPQASLLLFDAPEFRERTAIFRAGAKVDRLDREMGRFRQIESIRVTCTD